VDIAGNGRRPADILLKVCDGRRNLAVALTMALPNQASGGPLRGSASTFLRFKGQQKNRESADSFGRMGGDFPPMVSDTL